MSPSALRILYFANNKLGWMVGSWLRHNGESIVGLVLHPSDKRKFGAQILKDTSVGANHVFDATDLESPQTIEMLRSLEPDLGVSVLFGYRLKPPILAIPSQGCINVHPALLPYNRGAYPNVWSIIDGTPAGATIHYMNEEIDTGDILTQQAVDIEPTDTGESLYAKLEEMSFRLFRESWPLIRSGRAPRTTQPEGGAYHGVRDIDAVDEISLDRDYPARQLIDLIRARTFSGHQGAHFVHEGRKVFLRLELRYEDEIGE